MIGYKILWAVLWLLTACIALASAARIEIVGFESGTIGIECISTGTIQNVQTTTVYSGTYALQTNPTGTNTGHCVVGVISATGVPGAGNTTGTYYSVFRFRAGTLPASGSEPIFTCDDTSTTQKLSVRITSTGKLAAYDSAAAQLGSNGASTLSTNTWYLIGVKCGTGASAAYEVQLNGTTELSGTGNLNTSNHGQRTFGKRVNVSGQTVDFYYDDIVVDDAVFPEGNSIVALHPNANGSTMQFTAGTGASDYTQINEVVPVTTTYVQSTAQNDVALFRFDTLPGTLGEPIPCVKAMQRVAESVSNATLYQPRIRSSGVNNTLTAADVGNTSYVTRSYLRSIESASNPWTVATVNAVEAGGVDGTTTVSKVRIAWLVLLVEAAPAAAGPPARVRMSVY